MEAYLALALIRMEDVKNTEDSLLLSQSKFESAFIWLKSLDPNFDQVKGHLEHWARQTIIPQRTARLFLQKISGLAAASSNAEADSEKGKEEETLSDLPSLGR